MLGMYTFYNDMFLCIPFLIGTSIIKCYKILPRNWKFYPNGNGFDIYLKKKRFIKISKSRKNKKVVKCTRCSNF